MTVTASPPGALTIGADAYLGIRALTERLAAPLSAEDQTVQSMPDVSPTKWHRAHTSWFFEEFLLAPAGHARFHPGFAFLFNSYYETVGTRHPAAERGLISRPGIAEVARYREAVDEAMTALLSTELPPSTAGLVELGLHHEQQHQELLLMDVKHVLSCNPLRPAYRTLAARERSSPPPLEWYAHDGGLVEVGAEGGRFAFDNELPRHRQYLQPFLLASRLVTNGEWRAFMDDGGYQRPELWLSDGWATAQANGWAAPLYWSRTDDAWEIFTLAGSRPLDDAEPVCHISYYEADAYARWAGARLPSEAEWEVVAQEHPHVHAVDAVVLDLDVLHPRPVQDGGMAQLLGEVWEWTASPYTAYPGFRPAAGAVGEYNGKFMVNQQVLRGGSCATPPGHIRLTYRNFFPPAARWAFSGVRLARDAL